MGCFLTKTLTQKRFFTAPPKKLYEFYMNKKLHALLTGDNAKISKKVGSNFSAFDGGIKGKILLLKPREMIVHTWRGCDWKKSEKDSIFILIFREVKKSVTELQMIHANIPEKYVKDIREGWNDYYWKKWREYINSNMR